MHGCKLLFLLIPLILVALFAPKKSPPAEDLHFSPSTAPIQTEPAPSPTLELPCVARGSELIVEKILSYEGEFWEDGTNAYAVNIAALVVYNPAPYGIRKAEILICQGQRQLAFYISYLPPNSRVLVQERCRNAYAPGDLTQCRCTLLETLPWQDGALTVEDAGMDALLLKNETEAPLASVTLHYRLYSEEFGLYLGGISHQITASPLLPGESLRLQPAHYTKNRSRVTLVETEQ